MPTSPYHQRVLSFLSRDEARSELARLGIRSPADEWLADKFAIWPIRAENLDGRAAALLKQEMLALGGDCAVHHEVAAFDRTPRPVILLGTQRIYRRLIPRLKLQAFGLVSLGQELLQLLSRYEQLPPPIQTAHGVLSFQRTLVMGILNMTEGSFSGDGLGEDVAAAVAQGQAFAQAGADLLDVGGESTRPGAPEVEEEEELRRVIPALRALREEVPLPLSVDTRRGRVAREAVAAGADLINDIWALRQPGMLEAAAEWRVPVCLMHMQGTPQTMQQDPRYEDLITEIYGFLVNRLEAAVEAGVQEEHLLVDPGIGFGKLPQHNLEILRRLREFRSLGRPVLIGPSRKATIGHILDKPVGQRQWGTAAMVALGVANGANIIRVHDVEEMVQVVRVADAVVRGQW